jgi:parvulin-like peptidyl-prolyl isomerase
MSGRFNLVGLCTLIIAATSCKDGKTAPSAVVAAAKEPGAPPDIDGETPLPDPLPKVAATVNGQPVPIHSVKILAEQALRSGSVPADRRAFAYRKSLNQFIVRELLFQEAIAEGLSADEKKLDETEVAQRSQFKDDAAWKKALASQGMDEQTFKTELRLQHTVNALVSKVWATVPPDSITEEEVKRSYDEHRTDWASHDRVRGSHIFIRVPLDVTPSHKPVFREKAEQILAEIQKGGDFAALARTHSDDPASSSHGGELEPYGRGQLPPELKPLEDAMRALKPGEVSPNVVETTAGYHVVKLLERLPDEPFALDQVRDQVRQHLLLQKRNDALQAFVNRLRAKAKIETHL